VAETRQINNTAVPFDRHNVPSVRKTWDATQKGRTADPGLATLSPVDKQYHPRAQLYCGDVD
jgi:hypothetical protein